MAVAVTTRALPSAASEWGGIQRVAKTRHLSGERTNFSSIVLEIRLNEIEPYCVVENVQYSCTAVKRKHENAICFFWLKTTSPYISSYLHFSAP